MNILARSNRQISGFTILELTVSIAIAAIILVAVMYSFIFCSRSFVAMGNYFELNNTSLMALDKMTRDIREASSLVSFATNRLVFLDAENNQLTFNWDAGSRQLTRASGGHTQILLNDCDFLRFDISQRSPTVDGQFGFYSASNNPAICKLVSVSWRCSKNIMGQKANTESVQTAKIVMRN